MPLDPLKTGMLCMPCSYYSQFKQGPLFLKKNHPTKNPSYGPGFELQEPLSREFFPLSFMFVVIWKLKPYYIISILYTGLQKYFSTTDPLMSDLIH